MTSGNKTNVTSDKKNDPKLLLDGIHYTANKGPAIGARHVQVAVAAVGISITIFFKITFPTAVIAMTDNTTSPNADVPTYDWKNKSIIISSIFYGALCLPLIAGYFGKQYGPKWFFVCGSLIDCITFTCIPLAAKYFGSNGVIVCRIIEGLAQGMVFPMNTCISGRWVPSEERSKMGFIGILAITSCILIASTSTGFIVESDLGWPYVFYIFGGIGIVWCGVFAFTAEQSPATHPRITPEEKKYIQVSLGQKTKKVIPTPWKEIVASKHVWAIIVAQIGYAWIILILQTETTIFMTQVLKYSLKTNAILSIAPHLCTTFGGLVLSLLADYIPKRGILSLLNTRRVFQTVGQVGISTCFVLMTFIPVKYAILSVVALCIGYIFNMCTVVGGSDISPLDISPRFAGIIFGFYSTISQAISLIAPILVQFIVTDESDASQWRTIYMISAVISILSTIFYDIFATATRQPWDGEDDIEAKITMARRKSSILSIPELP